MLVILGFGRFFVAGMRDQNHSVIDHGLVIINQSFSEQGVIRRRVDTQGVWQPLDKADTGSRMFIQSLQCILTIGVDRQNRKIPVRVILGNIEYILIRDMKGAQVFLDMALFIMEIIKSHDSGSAFIGQVINKVVESIQELPVDIIVVRDAGGTFIDAKSYIAGWMKNTLPAFVDICPDCFRAEADYMGVIISEPLWIDI